MKTVKKNYPSTAIQFTVWQTNRAPISDEIVRLIEERIEQAILELFNEGHRLLTQTTRT